MRTSIKIVCYLIAAILTVSSASAYNFYAGGSDGWVQKPPEAYNSWAAKMRFQVHDNIVFKYKKGEDSVLLVNETDYDACRSKNPIKRMGSGRSVFHFARSGPFFFISGDPRRCAKGQKLIVVVMSERKRKPIENPIRALSPSPSPSPSPSLSPVNSPSPSPTPSLKVPPCEDDPLPPSPSPSVSDAPSPSPPLPSSNYAPVPSPDSHYSSALAMSGVSVVSVVMFFLGSTAFMF